jgi:hypothetical protein
MPLVGDQKIVIKIIIIGLQLETFPEISYYGTSRGSKDIGKAPDLRKTEHTVVQCHQVGD